MALELGTDLGIENVEALKQQLAPLLAAKRKVIIDATAVTRVHTASLQVLCAFARERRGAGQVTVLEPCAQTLLDAAQLLGVSAELGLAEKQIAPGVI